MGDHLRIGRCRAQSVGVDVSDIDFVIVWFITVFVIRKSCRVVGRSDVSKPIAERSSQRCGSISVGVVMP